jgi:quinol monooxygenase YgiN
MPYAVIARYRCDPQNAAAVREALLEMRERTPEEPANLLYIVHTDPDDEAAFTLYEQYADRAGFEAHTTTPHFEQHIRGTVLPRLTERTVSFLDTL